MTSDVHSEDLEPEWVPFEAIVATTHAVDKYGGVKLSNSALRQIAEALNGGLLPMLGHHDWTKPVRTQEIEATLVELEDGEQAVRLEGFVNQADWESVGRIRGMSFSTFVPIGRADGLNPDAPALKLSADAGWFNDEAIGEAASIMSELAPVEGARLLQFSAVDDARVILEMSYPFVLTLGVGLATNAVWDGIKHLLSRRQRGDKEGGTTPTRIELITPLPTGQTIAIIDTADASVVAQALAVYSSAVTAALERAAKERQVFVWVPEESGGHWILLT